MSSQRLVFRNGFVVSMDPDISEIPNGEVLVEDGVIVDVGPDLGVSDAEEVDERDDRHAGVRGHAPPHVADARARRPPVLHAGPATSQACSAASAASTAPRTSTSATTRLARGDQRRHDDAARLVAHQQHAGPLGRGRAGSDGRRHPRHLRARRSGRRRVVGVQRARPSRGHPPHPRHVLLVRRPAHDARARGARARQLELRGREARLGARARPRDPHQRARRHAADAASTSITSRAGRPRPARPGHDVHPLHGLDRRGARPHRIDRRHPRRWRRTSRC